MPRVHVADVARGDVEDIWEFIALDSVEAAGRQIARFRARFKKLAEFPEMGRASQELGAKIRRLPAGNYLILYRPIPNGVEIVRVLHGARDIETLLEGGEE